MPKAALPTNFKGWIIALIASFVGFISGFTVIKVMEDVWK